MALDFAKDTASTLITCDELAGLIEIHDPRLLRRGYEAFCRAFVRTAVACLRQAGRKSTWSPRRVAWNSSQGDLTGRS